MSQILDYYKSYFANGGLYKLEDYKDSSRVKMVLSWLKNNLKPGARVLDIGCGDGYYSQWASEFNWTGLDINEEKTKYNGTRVTCDIESFPYPLDYSNPFDAIVCSEVLEHLWAPEKVTQEIHKLLRPRGLYILSTPNFDWIEHHMGMFRHLLYSPIHTHLREHIRFYNFETHQQMLDKEGFTVVDCMGADVQFSKLMETARSLLKAELPHKSIGDVDYLLGRMFPLMQHTIGILSVKR